MMSQRAALEVLAAHRGTHVVVTTMSAVALWPELSDGPLDFAYLPSAMGQAPALGLGLASGRPAVVATTSGTAAVELHPAVVEASHAGVPLLAVTSDIRSLLVVG